MLYISYIFNTFLKEIIGEKYLQNLMLWKLSEFTTQKFILEIWEKNNPKINHTNQQLVHENQTKQKLRFNFHLDQSSLLEAMLPLMSISKSLFSSNNDKALKFSSWLEKKSPKNTKVIIIKIKNQEWL